VAVRYLCANLHLDHSSICEFRVVNEAAFRAAFVSVLQLALQLRLTKVGAVSVDGTKIQANASKHAAVSYQRAGELIEQLELEVHELIERAKQAEVAEARETLDVPAELTRRKKRVAALKLSTSCRRNCQTGTRTGLLEVVRQAISILFL
jgi:hypothetical protein